LNRYEGEPDALGYAQLVNVQSGKCLEVNGSTGAVDQWDCIPGAANELWKQVPNTVPNANGIVVGDALQVESSGEYLGTSIAPAAVGDGTTLVMQPTQGTNTSWSTQMN
jgi:hypothetical protein